MPRSSRNSTYQTANLSDEDSIDGLESPPHTAGAGYGRSQGRRDGGMSRSEGEGAMEYPKRSRTKSSSGSGRYANPFSEASGASSASSDSGEDEWAAPVSRKKGSSRSARRGRGDEEQALHTLGHRDGRHDEGDEQGNSSKAHKTQKAKNGIKAKGGSVVSHFKENWKWYICAVLLSAIVAGCIVMLTRK